MLEIIPAILTNDPEELEAKIKQLEGLVERVQIDIIDGVFADNKTIGLEALENLETNLLLDIHLMTKEPVEWVEHCVRAMADRIIGQVEMMSDQIEFVGRITKAGVKVGLALDLETPVSKLDPVILKDLDTVLTMSVKAGLGGQKFEQMPLEKIRELDEIRLRDTTPFRICVDGGITPEHVQEIKEAGADEIVVGSSLWEGDIAHKLEVLSIKY